MMTPQEMIEAYGPWVESALQSWFSEHAADVPAYAMAEYHLGYRDQALRQVKTSGGKLLRPILCFLSYQLFREDFKQVVPLAAATEVYHNHTLVFDDMQDGDRFRRSRPTVWSLWGIGQGINAGLILGYLAQDFFLRLFQNGFPLGKVITLFHAFTKTMMEVAEGQSLDLDFETRLDVHLEDYLEMISKKTGALISFSTFGGVFLAQDDLKIAEKFRWFGRKLGLAMQVRDDLVGIWGEKEQSGKERAKDLRRRKKTFPVFMAFDTLAGKELEKFQEYFKKSDEPQEDVVNEFVLLLEKRGIREACEKSANQFMNEVFAILYETGLPPEKLILLEGFSRYAFDSIGTLRQVPSRL